MKKSWTLGALLLAASLGACAMNAAGPRGVTPAGVDVTRFHLGQPIARAEIRVEPAAPGDPNFTEVATPIQAELARLGWNVMPSKTNTEQVAVARVSQDRRSTGAIVTELTVRIQRRSDATVFWEGRAVGEHRANPERSAAIQRLVTAMFRDFPGESGRTIRVR